jgi:hypothetical protein
MQRCYLWLKNNCRIFKYNISKTWVRTLSIFPLLYYSFKEFWSVQKIIEPPKCYLIIFIFPKLGKLREWKMETILTPKTWPVQNKTIKVLKFWGYEEATDQLSSSSWCFLSCCASFLDERGEFVWKIKNIFHFINLIKYIHPQTSRHKSQICN